MRYLKTVDIHALPVTAMVNHLQVGQWVSAGQPMADRSNCGVYYGIRGRGTIVVAWNGNARNYAKDKRHGWREYHQSSYHYAKGK